MNHEVTTIAEGRALPLLCNCRASDSLSHMSLCKRALEETTDAARKDSSFTEDQGFSTIGIKANRTRLKSGCQWSLELELPGFLCLGKMILPSESDCWWFG